MKRELERFGFAVRGAILTCCLFGVPGVVDACLPVCGDVDCSATVTTRDALLVLQRAIGSDVVIACSCSGGVCAPDEASLVEHACGDADCNGTLTVIDTLLLLRRAAGTPVPWCAGVCSDPATATTTTSVTTTTTSVTTTTAGPGPSTTGPPLTSTTIPCEPDELIDQYIEEWHRAKVVEDHASLLEYAAAVDWRSFMTPKLGELVPATAAGWTLRRGATHEAGVLTLPPGAVAVTSRLPVPGDGAAYQAQILFRWAGGTSRPGRGLRVIIHQMSIEGKWIRRELLPSDGPVFPIPALPDESDDILIEAPLELTPETASLVVRLENSSDASFEIEVVSVSRLTMMSIADGSLGRPLLIDRAQLPREIALDVTPAPALDAALAHLWEVEVDGVVVPSTVVSRDDGVHQVRFALDASPLARRLVRIRVDDVITGYGQVGILDRRDSLLLGFVTDQHYMFRGTQRSRRYREIMTKTIRQLGAHRPDLVFFNGDYDEDDQPLGNVLHDIEQLGVPVVVGEGNHEKDNQHQLKVRKYLSTHRSYFDLVWGGYQFVVMDGNELSADGGHASTVMSDEQLSWLGDVLLEHPAKTTVIVSEAAARWRTGSSWAKSDPEQARILQRLFSDAGVSLVVQGDKHEFDSQALDGVEYVTIPSATIPFRGEPRAGYGLVWLEAGAIRWAGMVETFEPDPADSHPPMRWSLSVDGCEVTPTGHVPVHHYSLPSLVIRREEDRVEIESINRAVTAERLPFRDGAGQVKLLDVPPDGATVLHDLSPALTGACGSTARR